MKHVSKIYSEIFLRIEILDTTRGATVTGCAPVVSFCCKGLY